MARTDTLTNFLTDIADSIRLKTGKTGKIAITNFDTEISKIALKEEAFNLFIQMEEPKLKEGIWIQTTNKLNNDITVTNKPIIGSMQFGEWSTATHLTKPVSSDDQRPILIGDWLYWIHYLGTDIDFRSYKLNLVTGQGVYLKDVPKKFGTAVTAAIGTNIYIFGGNSDLTYAYKYNTLDDTYSRISDIPRKTQLGAAAVIGDCVYFSPGRSGVASGHYASNIILCYDTTKNTYTEYTIPTYVRECGMTPIGDWIYFVGTFGNSNGINGSADVRYATNAYKWNVKTQEWVTLAELPIAHTYNHCKINGRILISCWNYKGHDQLYVYNPITNEFETSDTLIKPWSGVDDALIFHNNTLYGLASGKEIKQMQVIIDPDYSGSSDALVVYQAETDNNYQTTFNASENNSKLLTSFADVSYYSSDTGVISGIPIYYGNGTEWIKIKE